MQLRDSWRRPGPIDREGNYNSLKEVLFFILRLVLRTNISQLVTFFY